MKTWIMGFGIGVVMIVMATLVVACANVIVAMRTGMEISTYHLAMLLMVTWFMEVAVLIPFGSVPLKITLNAFTARWVFVWGPVSLGWYLAHYVEGPAFLVGLVVSSTCVGYNLVVTNVQKKT